MPRTIFRLLAAAVVSVALVSAQSEYTLKVDVPYVFVDVTVRDSFGKPVNSLTAEMFTIYEDGKRQEVAQFSPASAPYNVLLLFDRSGSTQDKWMLMQRAVAGFIDALRPQDSIEIAAFDLDFEVLLPWTGDRRQGLLALPQLLRAGQVGSTDFFAAVERSLRREFRDVKERRALVVLTDGRDTSLYKYIVERNRLLELKDDRPYQKALSEAKKQHIPTFIVAFNTDRNLQPNQVGADEYQRLRQIFPKSSMPDRYLAGVRGRMEELSAASGGRVLYPKSLEEVVPLYQQIGAELGTSYTLGYISSGSGGELRKVEVKTKDPQLRVTQSRDTYSSKR